MGAVGENTSSYYSYGTASSISTLLRREATELCGCFYMYVSFFSLSLYVRLFGLENLD